MQQERQGGGLWRARAESGMKAASMALRVYGGQSRPTLSEHWAVKAAKHCKSRTLMRIMRRLQMNKDTTPRDSAPLALDRRMLGRHTLTTKQEGPEGKRDADKEGLMQGKCRGQGVAEIKIKRIM